MIPILLLAAAQTPDSLPIEPHPQETNLRNVRQLTFGGQNAEAYWSADGTKITYQSTQPEYPDEQIFTMNADGSGKRLASTGKGRCTCSYFTPDGKFLYYSSTHERNEGPQAKPDMSQGYVWVVNPDFSLYRTPVEGGKPQRVLGAKGFSFAKNARGQTPANFPIRNGYVAETTIAPDGKFMVFTALLDGDLDIYRANLDGTRVRRLTDRIGYDGGPFVSWDSKKIVYRRAAIENDGQRTDYLTLLSQNLVRPSKLEIWIMDATGRNKRQVTRLGAGSFAPFLHPDGKRIIFSSNHGDPKGREFDLWMVDTDGIEPPPHHPPPEFDALPHVHPRRQTPPLGLQPQREGAGGDECVCGGLGRL
jgi:Tol biopolymer transport system component